MPTYEYRCNKCDHVFDVNHSFLETPEILCQLCGGTCKKQVTSFYMGKSTVSESDMKQDLRENYGIESVHMKDGSFSDFYAGVKQDGARVKEQMIKGKEEGDRKLAKKNADFMKPSHASRIQKIQDEKAKKDFKKRSMVLH